MDMSKEVVLDLRLFDGDGAGGAGGGEGTAGQSQSGGAAVPAREGRTARNPLANVQYGTQAKAEDPAREDTPQASEGKTPETIVTSDTLEAKKAEFERLIKGEYKDIFGERIQRVIDERFKQTKGLEERMTAVQPMLEMLAGRYGVKAEDPEALLKAIEDDDGYYEQEAVAKGMTVEQLKEMKRMQRENSQLRAAMEQRQRQESADRMYRAWMEQAEAVKQMYPGFDLQAECNHPVSGQQFVGLLKSNVPIRTAYEVIHKDEIIGGAMQYTAQQVQQKTVNDIRARGLRPQENGTGGQAAAEVKTDVHKLTRADREEIARRVARGERISF